MISKCRRAGHPYLDGAGQIIEENVYINRKGAVVCKACRRTGNPVGRPSMPFCPAHGAKDRDKAGKFICKACRLDERRGATTSDERVLIAYDMARLPTPTPEELEADRLAVERYAKLYE